MKERQSIRINYFWIAEAIFGVVSIYLGANASLEGALICTACIFALVKTDQVISGNKPPPEDDICFIDLYRGEMELEHSKGVTAVSDIAIDSFYIHYKKPAKKADYNVTSNDGTQSQRFEVKHYVNYVFLKLHTPILEKEPNNIIVTRKRIN